MKKILLIVVLLLCGLSAVAQSARPIRWRMTVKMTSETEGVATLRAVVEPGWHLYGTAVPDGGPKATKFSLTGSKGVEATGNIVPSVAAKTVQDPVFGMELTWWDSNVSFSLPFKVTTSDATLSVTVNFMGCNDETCLPPSHETLTYKFQK